MNNQKQLRVKDVLVCVIIIVLSALLSGYLTFKVQFERRKEHPETKTKELSFQTLRIKEQEHKQKHEHFHLVTEDVNLEAWAEKSSCLICHSPYPHGKNKKAKAIMNLHTEFLTCQSCHLKFELGMVKFGWINPTAINPQGKPYGTEIDTSSGLFSETDDHYSKLTPLIKINDSWSMVPSIDTDEIIHEAKRYMKNQDWLSPEQKKQIVDQLHGKTELKEFIKCSQCHNANGIMNFNELGFDAARINQLVKMEIGGMLTNYDIFYLPQVFEEKFK